MSTIGLVLTVDTSIASLDFVSEALAWAGPFRVGDRFGSKLAVALEAADAQVARDWTDWASEVPGVIRVDIAFAAFGEPAAAGVEVNHVA